MYIPRYLEDIILKTHRTFKVLYLGGPRQVGKTTLLSRLAQRLKMRYVSLDDLSARELARQDPELFLQKFPAPLFIDEVQYAPALFPFVKLRVDGTKRNGQYWLTGSQQFSIMKNLQESLAGRVGILSLLGFSAAEEQKIPKVKMPFLPMQSRNFYKPTDLQSVFRRIFRGFFPALASRDPPSIEMFFNSYVQTYLDRDLRDIFNISRLSTFHIFLQLCAARTGQILNYSALASDAGVSVHAAREWIHILETSMQIYLLKPYYRNVSKRIIKSPKLYFLDTGLAAFLTKWKSPESLMSGAMAGAFFETYIIGEIIKSYLYRGEEPPIYYFRDKEHHEVDLLIERNNTIYPIEIKIASRINASAVNNMIYFRKKIPNAGNGAVICLAKNQLPIDRMHDVISVGTIS